MRNRQSNYGIFFFFFFFSNQACLLACLLLIISKLTGTVMANITASNNCYSSYPVIYVSSPVPQIKYDVFVSFRGDDIRKGLLSHVLDALSRKQIVAFSDNKLEKGDGISEALLGAIERSSISLVIFSPDFASSHWCLDEVVKIAECRRKNGQILLPVFYQVDPTVVRHQKGTYGNALEQHLLIKNYSSSRVQTWKSALGESANISGIVSSDYPNDAKLVEEIVKEVSTNLKHVQQVSSKGLVGIEKPISHVESLLHLESGGVHVIGIWGIGGIGKTTIAEEVFNRLSSKFESCCFMANVREESERQGLISLKKKLFSTLLGEQDLQIDTINGLPNFVERRIRRLKVLIVLDDVNDSQHLEILVGTLDWFGSGSRIIITTRDKQVLAGKVNDIHEVSPLDSDESFRLFNLNAFKENHLAMEYYELAKKMVDYAKGVPLVLKVLGHLLHGKGEDIWKSQSMMLKKVQIKEFHNVLRPSYNDLHHNERRIFLDIACFFDGLNLKVNDIKRLLKDREYSVTMGLERLKDKTLITISQENIVSMHDLIQEMAWEIVREESIEDPGKRSRLLDPDDIYQVLKYNKGSEAIRSMVVNMTIIKQLQLSPQVFDKMSNLQFLDIYAIGSHSFLHDDERGLYLPQGLESLPTELRYLRWAYYPLDSLPSKFSAEKLAE